MSDMSEEMFDAVKAVVNFSRYDAQYVSLTERKGSSTTLRENDVRRREYFDKRFAEIAAEHGVDADQLRVVMQRLMEPKMAAEVQDMNERGYPMQMPKIASPGRT